MKTKTQPRIINVYGEKRSKDKNLNFRLHILLDC